MYSPLTVRDVIIQYRTMEEKEMGPVSKYFILLLLCSFCGATIVYSQNHNDSTDATRIQETELSKVQNATDGGDAKESTKSHSTERNLIGVFFVLLLLGFVLMAFLYGVRAGKVNTDEPWNYMLTSDAQKDQVQNLMKDGWRWAGIIQQKPGEENQNIHLFKKSMRQEVLMPKRRLATSLAFYFLGVVILLMAIMSGGSISMLIDVPSFLIVCVGTLSLTFVNFSHEDLLNAFKCALFHSKEKKDHVRGLFFLQAIRKYISGLTILGNFIGLCIVIVNLDSPAQIGPGLATALICVIYGFAALTMIITPWESQISLNLQYAIQSEGDN